MPVWKGDFKRSLSEQALYFAFLFCTNTIVKCTQARFILCQGLLKQSFLTLQLVIRQQDQEFDQQCILPVNKAAMAVSDKWSSHITYYKCHNSHHYPNSAYSFSHPSTLKYLRSTQTDKERPQSMIKDITSKSNNTQDQVPQKPSLVRICLESQIKSRVVLQPNQWLSNLEIVGSKILAVESLSVQIMYFQANLNWSNCTTFLTFLLIQTT